MQIRIRDPGSFRPWIRNGKIRMCVPRDKHLESATLPRSFPIIVFFSPLFYQRPNRISTSTNILLLSSFYDQSCGSELIESGSGSSYLLNPHLANDPDYKIIIYYRKVQTKYFYGQKLKHFSRSTYHTKFCQIYKYPDLLNLQTVLSRKALAYNSHRVCFTETSAPGTRRTLCWPFSMRVLVQNKTSSAVVFSSVADP
jgi:hypothetical protein